MKATKALATWIAALALAASAAAATATLTATPAQARTKLACAVVVLAAAALQLWLPATAQADCNGPSDTCTNSEMRYLQALQNDGFDVSDGKANDWLKNGNVVCADLAGGHSMMDELNWVWRSASGNFTQTQAMQLVGLSKAFLCPR
jgi:hypothetical protein